MDGLDAADGDLLRHHRLDAPRHDGLGGRPPTIQRKGFLPISTTRGDRFFIGLLTSAFIHVGWIAFTDLSLWIALAISAVWMVIVMRFG
jgi:predicted small integral membrane protein